MKKLLVTSMVLGAGFFMASSASAVITGSAHDLSVSEGEICIVCHTPHNADNTIPAAPLWNHEVTAAVYTLYTSSTLDASDLSQPDGVSKLCLSCHDGTVAVDSYGGATGGTTIGGGANLGIDLGVHHPVSFTYNDALATLDTELHPPTTTASGIVAEIDDDMLFGAGNDQLECSSCHDVHNAAGLASLLVKSNVTSALCLTCHDK